MTRSNTRKSHRILVFALAVLVASAVQPWRLLAQAPSPAKGVKFAQISEADMKEWLTYLSSDELQGRQIYTEGYGLAAQYIADHLKAWGVKPIGDNGSYFQIVRMKGYRVANNSSITITGPDGTKTFKNGDHVTFPTNAGKKQTVTFDGVQFIGSAPAEGTKFDGKLVVWDRRGAGGGSWRASGWWRWWTRWWWRTTWRRGRASGRESRRGLHARTGCAIGGRTTVGGRAGRARSGDGGCSTGADGGPRTRCGECGPRRRRWTRRDDGLPELRHRTDAVLGR